MDAPEGSRLEAVLPKSPVGDDLPGGFPTQKDLTIMPQPHRRPCPHLTTTAAKLKLSGPFLALPLLCAWPWGAGWAQTSALGGEKGRTERNRNEAHHVPPCLHCCLTQARAGEEVKP